MIRLLFFTVAVLFCIPTDAQSSFFTYLGSVKPEKVVIISDWDSLTALKDNSSWDARLMLTGDGIHEEWKAELTVRGRYRRAKCVFPPLEINLKKGALRDHGFAEFDKLKLVTHCDEANLEPTDLYEELLIYQLYELLTPFCFHALPLNIDYQYPNGRPYRRNAVGLLLEPTAEVVARVGGREFESYGATEDSLDATSYLRNALFQFMVGNFDWDHIMQRNVKMIGPAGQYHLVPYDFDFSAIVAPSYMRVPGELELKDYRDRIYLGQCFGDQLPQMISEFMTSKEKLLAHAEAYPYLNKTRKREIIAYLEEFFKFISDPTNTITRGTVIPYQ